MHRKNLRIRRTATFGQSTDLLALAKVAAAICLATLLMGCGVSESSSKLAPSPQTGNGALPVVSAHQLSELVRESDQPVLAEFGVQFGCARCDDMRPHMARLMNEFQGRAHLVRVDYNAHRELAAELGAAVCPSYVLFRGGNPYSTHQYPTSPVLLAADLTAAAAMDGEESTSMDKP